MSNCLHINIEYAQNVMWHWLGEGLHDTNKKKKIEFKVGEKKS